MAGMRARNVLMVYPRFVADFILQFPRRLRGDRPAVRRRASRLDNRRGAASARMERALPRPQCRGTDRRRPRVGRPRHDGRHARRNSAIRSTIIECAARAARPVAVGGPDATSSPHVYREADFQVIGEAEGIIGRIRRGLDGGASARRIRGREISRSTSRKSPIPRFDLLKLENYLYVGVQFSRGCPFTCEFCDIIELYGRVPRTKTNDQMLAELRRALSPRLSRPRRFRRRQSHRQQEGAEEVSAGAGTAGSQAHGYPFEFATEASINLADDAAAAAS